MQSISILQNHILQLYKSDLDSIWWQYFYFSSDLSSVFEGKQCSHWVTSSLVKGNGIDITIGDNQVMTWCEVPKPPLSSLWSVLFEK